MCLTTQLQCLGTTEVSIVRYSKWHQNQLDLSPLHRWEFFFDTVNLAQQPWLEGVNDPREELTIFIFLNKYNP